MNRVGLDGARFTSSIMVASMVFRVLPFSIGWLLRRMSVRRIRLVTNRILVEHGRSTYMSSCSSLLFDWLAMFVGWLVAFGLWSDMSAVSSVACCSSGGSSPVCFWLELTRSPHSNPSVNLSGSEWKWQLTVAELWFLQIFKTKTEGTVYKWRESCLRTARKSLFTQNPRF